MSLLASYKKNSVWNHKISNDEEKYSLLLSNNAKSSWIFVKNALKL